MYKLVNKVLETDIQMVKNMSTMAHIPFDEKNLDYQAYLKWLDGYELVDLEWVKTSDSNEPLPADE
jgi:hypothetical protein